MRRVLFVFVALLAAIVLGPPILAPLLGEQPDPSLKPAPGKSIAINDDLTLNVVDIGSGTPVVLVHGLPSNAYDWSPFSHVLAARGYRVIAYDRVGYGYSSRSSFEANRYTLESNAADLRGLLDALGLQRVVLIGWSYGGGVAQTFAEQSPERVSHLILIASVGPAQPAEDSNALGAILSSPIGGLILRWVSSVPPLARSMTHDGLVEAFSRAQAIPPHWEEYTRLMLALPGTLDSFTREAQRSHYDQMKPESLQVPTLILQGTDDRSVPPSVANDLHQRIHGSELATIAGASHMMPVVNADVLVQDVTAFLAQPRGTNG
ncbi:MAG TPA: alpha/beta hydrolase [Candidatus Acidoferrales bacterium]|nr:alpha/beta hydrolase [Candidatus Acidoferrales bacterium]